MLFFLGELLIYKAKRLTYPLHLSCVLHLWQHESCGKHVCLQNNLHVSFSQAAGHRVHPHTLLCTPQIQLSQHLWDGFPSCILSKNKIKISCAIVSKVLSSSQLLLKNGNVPLYMLDHKKKDWPNCLYSIQRCNKHMMHLQKNTEWMLHNSDSLFDHEHRLVAIKCKTNWMKVG